MNFIESTYLKFSFQQKQLIRILQYIQPQRKFFENKIEKMAAHPDDFCVCGEETFVMCDNCDLWFCTKCADVDHWTDEEIREAGIVWCVMCQTSEFERAQHRLSERAHASQEAIERCLKTRASVFLTNPPSPRPFDEVMRLVRRFHSLLHVEAYEDLSGHTRHMVVGKDHAIDSPKAWNAISLIAVYFLNIPTWIDPLDGNIIDIIEAERESTETYLDTMRRLVFEKRLNYDDCYMVPQFAHDVQESFTLPRDEPLVKCMCNQLIQRVMVRQWGVFDFTTGTRCNALAPAQHQEPSVRGQALMAVLIHVMNRPNANVGRRDHRYRRRRAAAWAGRFIRG